MQVAGFSGTNDNQPLLPLTVKAMASADPHIKGTDGRMLCLLARSNKCSVTVLQSPPQASHPRSDRDAMGVGLWRQLLQLAVESGAQALIDAGAERWMTYTCHIVAPSKMKCSFVVFGDVVCCGCAS